ncbi:hypothetical protein [Candidatus Scalindua japonica]|uniref:hypothetical protein n=1 Tax=Candidatus Scalindua japonica TaxID=1284222 RepID=UPI0013A5310A|nr:hypothetical protein [Candidatus Scalindua japonica]
MVLYITHIFNYAGMFLVRKTHPTIFVTGSASLYMDAAGGRFKLWCLLGYDKMFHDKMMWSGLTP